jgi:O-acetyl-ADP-ribose deacetylase (regulator of RNase III)
MLKMKTSPWRGGDIRMNFYKVNNTTLYVTKEGEFTAEKRSEDSTIFATMPHIMLQGVLEADYEAAIRGRYTKHLEYAVRHCFTRVCFQVHASRHANITAEYFTRVTIAAVYDFITQREHNLEEIHFVGDTDKMHEWYTSRICGSPNLDRERIEKLE